MATQRTSKQRKAKVETPEEEMLRLYEPFRFLEADHWGEYLLVAPDGRYVLNADEIAAMDEAYKKFGNGLFMFKVGEIVTGKLPWLRGL